MLAWPEACACTLVAFQNGEDYCLCFDSTFKCAITLPI